jgi:hypothetical protein
VRPQLDGKWAAHEIGATAWHESKVWVQEGFFEGLVLTGRCVAGSTGQDPSAYGFRTWQEAQAAAQLLIAIDWMWTDDIVPCLRELDRALRLVPHPVLAGTYARIEEYDRRERLWSATWDDPLTGPLVRAINEMFQRVRALPAGAEAAR